MATQRTTARTRMPLTRSGWIALADDPDVRGRIAADPVHPLYTCLVAYFSRPEPIVWSEAVAALHVVHGVLPTRVNSERIAAMEADRRDRLVAGLNAVRKKGAIGADGILAFAEFAGNSVAGASRLLHFLSPQSFPAWDGRAAKSWLQRGLRERMHEQVPLYLGYRDALRAWSQDAGARHSMLGLRGLAPGLEGVSALRLMELVLVHAEPRAD
jgi:hypothetical protein